MITDGIGFITLTQALYLYHYSCIESFQESYNHGEVTAKVKLGPGYLMYLVCLLAAFLRALMHWLTPIPGEGSGCRLEIPKPLYDKLLEKFDKDGDGEISWEEIKQGF